MTLEALNAHGVKIESPHADYAGRKADVSECGSHPVGPFGR